jgi:hypothetical protein
MSKNQEVKLNAGQRLILLEQESDATKDNLNYCQNQLVAFANTVDQISNVLVKLSRQVHAMVQLSENNQPVNTKTLANFLKNEEVQVMEETVQTQLEQGVLLKSEDDVITERSFIVGRELDKDGNVQNPRWQFAIPSLDAENQKLFVGKKKGDLVQTEADHNSLEIVTVYQLAELTSKNFEEVEPKVEPKVESLPE